MNRDNKKLEDRASYIQEEINSRPVPVTRAVSQLSNELFISERTVWRDYKK